jgi:glycosyltransferase involved in cell wall biosynthesis
MALQPGPAQGSTVVVLGAYAPSLILFRGKLIEALIARGHRVVAMASDIPDDVAKKLRALGAEPQSVPIANQSLSPLSALATAAALARQLRAIRPIAIIAYTAKPVTLGGLAARLVPRARFVPLITGLGYAFIQGKGARRRLARNAATLLYRLALRRSRTIIFQNTDDRDFFSTQGLLPSGIEPVVVGGSGIDLDHFAPAPLPSGPAFLMISRLLGDKGVREYLAAAVRLKARHPEVDFRLIGYFDQSPDAIRRAELDAAVAGGVDYLGRQEDVRPGIAAASVYVLPSYHEGTPRSVLEAMAMGRPIITTDVPGCRQTVEAGVNGLLVPARDTDALAAAMEQLIEAPGRIAEMGARSRELAAQRFDVHRVNDAIIAAAGL